MKAKFPLMEKSAFITNANQTGWSRKRVWSPSTALRPTVPIVTSSVMSAITVKLWPKRINLRNQRVARIESGCVPTSPVHCRSVIPTRKQTFCSSVVPHRGSDSSRRGPSSYNSQAFKPKKTAIDYRWRFKFYLSIRRIKPAYTRAIGCFNGSHAALSELLATHC